MANSDFLKNAVNIAQNLKPTEQINATFQQAPVNTLQGQPVTIVIEDVGAISTNVLIPSQPFTGKGFWFSLAQEGTTPGVEFTVIFDAQTLASATPNVRPGAFFRHQFESFRLVSTGLTEGRAVIRIGRNAETDYREYNVDSGNAGLTSYATTQKAGETLAIGLNAPLPTQAGFNFTGLDFYRVLLNFNATAQAPGSIALWLGKLADPTRPFNSTTNQVAWYAGPITEDLEVGPTALKCSSDFQVGVSQGRVFAQLYNYGTFGVEPDVTVTIEGK